MKSKDDNLNKRAVFDTVAELYDQSRPGYPEKLFEDIISLSSIPNGGDILEIGCGTGQATLPFACRGYRMLCLDIGRNMAALAAKKCEDYPDVHFEVKPFEEWQPLEKRFDLVISGTAFHWIPPEIGYPKAASVLKPNGALAIFQNHHPRPFTDFFVQVQSIYKKWWYPNYEDPDAAPTPEEEIRGDIAHIEQTGQFQTPCVERYPWSRKYTADEYVNLISTYSNHRLLPEENRRNLHAEIHALIEELGGEIERPYLTGLIFAGKK
jgi:SAM-dependent methyltransferase